MAQLTDTATRLPVVALRRLSGLDRRQIAALRRWWPTVPVERRRHLAHALVGLAEDDFELDLNDVFRSLLTDSDAEVRGHAVEGMWEDDRRSTAELLLALLARDPTPSVRARVAVSLGHFTWLAEMDKLDQALCRQVKEGLLLVIRNGAEPLEVRRRAVEALGWLTDDEVAPIIEDAYRDSHLEMRVSAVFAMGRHSHSRWVDILLRELCSSSPEMRYEAARACGELKDRRAVPGLVSLLGDPDLEVRLAAINALGQIGGKRAHQALQRCLESDKEKIRSTAEEALEELEAFASTSEDEE